MKRLVRSPQFYQNFHQGAHFQNCDGGKCGPPTTWTTDVMSGIQAAAVPAQPAAIPVQAYPMSDNAAAMSQGSGCFCNNRFRSGRQFHQFFQSKPNSNFMMSARAIASPTPGRRGTNLCTYPGGKATCRCICDPFTFIYPNTYQNGNTDSPVHNSWPFNSYFPPWLYNLDRPMFGSTNIGKRRRRSEVDINTRFDELPAAVKANKKPKKHTRQVRGIRQFYQQFAPGAQLVNCQGTSGKCEVPKPSSWPILTDLFSGLSPFSTSSAAPIRPKPKPKPKPFCFLFC
jgi:hypothetical protein